MYLLVLICMRLHSVHITHTCALVIKLERTNPRRALEATGAAEMHFLKQPEYQPVEE